MHVCDFPDEHKALFTLRSGRDFEPIWIVPDSLSLDEIYSMLFLVCDTFVRVELEFHGILFIPYRHELSISLPFVQGQFSYGQTLHSQVVGIQPFET